MGDMEEIHKSALWYTLCTLHHRLYMKCFVRKGYGMQGSPLVVLQRLAVLETPPWDQSINRKRQEIWIRFT